MPRKRVIKKRGAAKQVIRKHSVKANMHVVELTRAGTSLDLEIYAENEKIGINHWPGVAFMERWEETELGAYSVE